MRVNCKWLGVSLLLGVMFLSGCGLPAVKMLQARDYLNKGVNQFSNQRYDAAAQLFERSLELDPKFEIARMYLGTAYMSQFIPGSSDPRNEQVICHYMIEIETWGISEVFSSPAVDAVVGRD